MGAGFFDANRKELFDRRGSATFGAILEDDEDACAVGAGTELVATEAGLVHVVECRIRGEMKTWRDRDANLLDVAVAGTARGGSWAAALLGPLSGRTAEAAAVVVWEKITGVLAGSGFVAAPGEIK
jgi:hypothetical protein